MIGASEATEIRARIAKHEEWRCGRTSYPADDVPEDARVTNEEISALEVFEFVDNPPAHLYAYYRTEAARGSDITTWTGDALGTVIDAGEPWRSNVGDKRRSIVVRAINGRTYSGTAYLSSGNYCRLRMRKVGAR